MSDFININGNNLRLSHRENGRTMACVDDILRTVGLPEMAIDKNFEIFIKLIGHAPETLLNFVCYESDIRRNIAQQRIKKYLLIDAGVKLTRTSNPDLRENDFEVTRYYLELLDDTWYTQSDIFEMLEEEGFKVQQF